MEPMGPLYHAGTTGAAWLQKNNWNQWGHFITMELQELPGYRKTTGTNGATLSQWNYRSCLVTEKLLKPLSITVALGPLYCSRTSVHCVGIKNWHSQEAVCSVLWLLTLLPSSSFRAETEIYLWTAIWHTVGQELTRFVIRTMWQYLWHICGLPDVELFFLWEVGR